MVAVVVAGLLATSCSSGDDEVASTCEALQDLSASVQSVLDVDVIAVGTDGLHERLDAVGERWQVAQDTTEGQLGPELSAFHEAGNAVRATIAGVLAGDETLAAAAPELGDELGDLHQAWDDLAAAAGDQLSDCDLSGGSS